MKKIFKIHHIKDETGKIREVSMRIKDFDALIDTLADLQDLHIVHERSLKKMKLIPIEEVGRKLFGYGKKK
jgi:hypothetical protein